LVGVHAPPAVLLDGETLIGSVVPDDSIRQREIDYFASTQARLKNEGTAVAADLLDGGVISSLAEYARQVKPAWIVMLSHSRGALARFFLGETAVEFVRQSPSPVLLIHSTDTPTVPTISRVLIPLDGSELAERIVEPATALAKLADADVTFVMALASVPDIEAIAARHQPGIAGPWDPAVAPEKARLYLEQVADRVRAASVRAHCRVELHASAGEMILREASATPGTVIALTTHGRGGISKLVWGSVTDQVVRHTLSPVLVFRPQEL
jgi:nucleotide-binding universal stress UspA family protein